MRRGLSLLLMGVFVLGAVSALAIDRDARFILNPYVSFEKDDDADALNYGLDAELALGKAGKLGLLVGGGLSDIDLDSGNDADARKLNLGLNYYVSPETSVGIELAYGTGEIDIQEFETRAMPEYGVTAFMDWDVEEEIEVWGLALQVKHRFIPVKEKVSPYVLARLFVGETDVDVSGTVVGGIVEIPEMDAAAPAEDVISVDYDTEFGGTLAVGVDVSLAKNVGLDIGAFFTHSEGGGSSTVFDEEEEFEDDSSDIWGGGAALRFFL